jgi:hypothetical protein
MMYKQDKYMLKISSKQIKTRCNGILFFIFMMLVSSSNASQVTNIPEQLQEWVGWVLKDDPTVSCPIAYNRNQHICAYADFLTIDIGEKTGSFQQEWEIYAKSWVPLPGDNKFWPENVKVTQEPQLDFYKEPQRVFNREPQPVVIKEPQRVVNKEPQLLNSKMPQPAVISRKGKPYIQLEKGHHHLSGEFNWPQQPKSLSIPDGTGLINLTIDKKKVNLPDFREGRLWLKTTNTKTHQNNRLDLQVFRKITDSIPLSVTTQIKLEVSGQQREIILQGALLKDFIPAAIQSRLPALLDKQGRLIVQVRPGQWNINISAYYPQQLTSVALPEFNKPWPSSEIWVLDQQPQLRRINVIDKISIDANQTQLPKNWKTYPAFHMQSNEQLSFNVIKRGDPEPEPDQLNLSKKIWLDFDGNGYTVNDKITGKLSRQWRLNAATDVMLGQITLNGKPQYITQDDKQQQGVEVRHGDLNLSADSRINSDVREFSAGGWDIDFNTVKATLYLPAGWKLFSLNGANSNQTWLKQWTLLDLFVVLITALAMYKLWGIRWGVTALTALILTWHQAWAPQFIWINLIIAVALFRALPEGKLSKLVRSYRFITTIILVLIVLPFVVNQARIALYPQLEFQNAGVNNNVSSIKTPAPSGPVLEEARDMGRTFVAKSMAEKKSKKAIASSYYSSRQSIRKDREQMNSIDPDATIQTGPGLPSWTLHQYPVFWDGPVRSDQKISIMLISPLINSLLYVLRIVFVLLLVWRLLDIPLLKTFKTTNGSVSKSTLTTLLIGGLFSLLLVLSPVTSEASFPSQTLLDELHSELIKPAECLPECAAIEAMSIDLSAQQLDIQLRVHAQEDVSIPLPVPIKQWVPGKVSIDGQHLDEQRVGMFRNKDSTLWLHLPRGRHLIKLGGRVDYINQLQIGFPLKPHLIRLNVKGWSSAGMDQDTAKISALNFLRNKSPGKSEKKTSSRSSEIKKSEIPVYAEITRTLNLGLDWHVTTRVQGISGTAYPVILTIPLMPGESVITDNIKVEGKNAVITLSRNNHSVQWTSKLPHSSQISLKAIESDQMIERWILNTSPIWHIEYQGIPVIYHQRQGDHWQPEWQPWPGEKVVVTVTKPQGVKGKTITIDSSTLTLTPGEQITAAKLEFNLRSSLGGQHTLHLPENAELQTVSINNRNMPIRNTAEGLSLPVLPGNQKIKIQWNESRGIAGIFDASEVSLGSDSVNNMITINPGYNRWVLFTSGPSMGPAVLFWGIFGVILLISYGLGRIQGTPLNTLQWVLLWIGLSASAPWAAVIILGCILALKVRGDIDTKTLSTLKFNLFQIMLVVLILLSITALIASIKQGLLGTPDMQITGNGSTAYRLNWFSDRINEETPKATLISVPVTVYRLMMLAWSIWLAFALIKWAQWGWGSFTQQEYWRHIVIKSRLKKKARNNSNKKDLHLDESAYSGEKE